MNSYAVREAILGAIRADRGGPRHEERRFRISEMGLCPRARVLKRRGVAALRKFTDFDLWRFKMGHIIHGWLQTELQKAGVLVDCETEVGDGEDFRGYHDGRLVLDGRECIVEIKTMGPFFYNRLAAQKGPLEENHIVRRYVRQLMTYCHFAGVEEGRLLLVRMSLEDSKAGRQHPPVMELGYRLADWRQDIEAEIAALKGWWRRGELPPCTCADGDGWWVKRCDYYDGATCCQL